ncbi:ATP-NAD kinase [Labrys miyagiensis]|uniref:ATP-NAD kinase n=1 Tax=Labrys miyagiensis TaxID=346912 RepID=A0ABQ6CPD6_9HYPH|nr:ATP-NAD kinase family protein [Labrys miyagiensis]GLS21675.1 ATP-NAD kinase [Labrys miyagiensis]
MKASPKRLGFLVNPLAGLGGRVGLKGSDGSATVMEALARGALPAASQRALIALSAVADRGLVILTAAGSMGEEACRAAGIEPRVVHGATTWQTTAGDTISTVRAFIAAGVDLILFAGGDGTARDIASAVGQQVPLVGIPAGVKMYSGVFAISPAHAGQLARHFLSGAERGLREAEILDVDEESLRQGRPATRLYGYALVPRDPAMQAAKFSAVENEEAVLGALCRAAAQALEPGHLHIIGPGSTMQRLLSEAGLTGTLLGIDLVLDGALVAGDASEAVILKHLKGRPAVIHVGVIGGIGCLFGRGNHPISPAVLRHVGRDNLRVLATQSKLSSLERRELFVDTGDAELDRSLGGYIRIQTAPRIQTLMRVRGF